MKKNIIIFIVTFVLSNFILLDSHAFLARYLFPKERTTIPILAGLCDIVGVGRITNVWENGRGVYFSVDSYWRGNPGTDALSVFADTNFMVLSDSPTILSAPCPLRFVAHDPESWFATPDTAAARELNETLLGINGEVSVNAKPANLLKPGAKPQLVSVTFEDATPLSRVYVGGAAGSPRWKRAWNGSIAEMLFFAGILDENQTASVLKYLSVKHKLGLPPQAADNPTKTLKDLGVSHGGVFATMTLVR